MDGQNAELDQKIYVLPDREWGRQEKREAGIQKVYLYQTARVSSMVVLPMEWNRSGGNEFFTGVLKYNTHVP